MRNIRHGGRPASDQETLLPCSLDSSLSVTLHKKRDIFPCFSQDACPVLMAPDRCTEKAMIAHSVAVIHIMLPSVCSGVPASAQPSRRKTRTSKKPNIPGMRLYPTPWPAVCCRPGPPPPPHPPPGLGWGGVWGWGGGGGGGGATHPHTPPYLPPQKKNTCEPPHSRYLALILRTGAGKQCPVEVREATYKANLEGVSRIGPVCHCLPQIQGNYQYPTRTP